MYYKLIVYMLVVLSTTFAVSGLNINKYFKPNRIWEARIFLAFLIISISQLVVSFIFGFLEASQIL